MDRNPSQVRRARRGRQIGRLEKQVTILRDALLLVQRMCAEGNKNDPAVTIRNVRAITDSAVAAMK